MGADDLLGFMNGDSRKSRRRRDWMRIGGAVLACLALVLVWRYTPLKQFADVDWVQGWLMALRGNVFCPLILLGAFVVGAFVVFPFIFLLAATCLSFCVRIFFVYV